MRQAVLFISVFTLFSYSGTLADLKREPLPLPEPIINEGSVTPLSSEDIEDIQQEPNASDKRAEQDVVQTGKFLKDDITRARFGEGDRLNLLAKARTLKESISTKIVGQDKIAQSLQSRLIQYLMEYGSRSQEPVALHLIGLPAVGKSAMLTQLEQVLPVIRVHAQQFKGADVHRILDRIENIVTETTRRQAGGPVVLLIDEIDKLAEIQIEAGMTREETNVFIGGFLNTLLNDGTVNSVNSATSHRLFNVFVVTTMNFSPTEIQEFSAEVLGAPKSYYDFSVEDFAKFSEWIQKSPGAVARVLSKLFRSNTVSRIAPNAMMVNPLGLEDYRKIIRITLDDVIQRLTSGSNTSRRVEVTYSDALVDFFMNYTVNAPLGARETRSRVSILASQLIQYGMWAKDLHEESLNRPRKLHLDHEHGTLRSVIRVTPQVLNQRSRRFLDLAPFTVPIDFDPSIRTYMEPESVAKAPPA